MKVEVDVLGSPSLIIRTVSVDVKRHRTGDRTEHRSCVKVEVAVLSFPAPYRPYCLWT